MKLKLTRFDCGETATLGELSVNGQFECYTLEDKDRKLEVRLNNKVYGETCIPRGIYKVIVTYSQRFRKDLPLLLNVPSFEGIRIHPGNTHEDTHGCPLTGTAFTKKGNDYSVQNSRNAFIKLFAKIEAALADNDDVEIEIV